MAPAEHLSRVVDLLEEAAGELEEAAKGAPKFATDPLRLLRAEVTASARRASNAARVLGSSRAGGVHG